MIAQIGGCLLGQTHTDHIATNHLTHGVGLIGAKHVLEGEDVGEKDDSVINDTDWTLGSM